MANEIVLLIISALLSVIGILLLLIYRKVMGDIKGVSINSRTTKVDVGRKLTIMIASDLEAAAPGNADVKRLAKMLLDLELWK